MADWQTKSSEVVYETPWFSVYRDEVLNHTGKALTYSYLKLPHSAVTVIAVDTQGRILLQKNYRYAIRQSIWEVPAGHMEADEDPLEAAKHELFEEAGLESDDWSSLGEARLGAGVADIHHHLFAARDVRHTTAERDEDEDISDQKFVTVGEVKRMILANEIVDGDSLIGLYRYLLETNEEEK